MTRELNEPTGKLPRPSRGTTQVVEPHIATQQGAANVAIKHGMPGDDIISGTSGPDQLFGEAGDDRLSGGDGPDVLEGGLGNDVLRGGADNDILRGSGTNNSVDPSGRDQLFGGDGIDQIEGGRGIDLLSGGVGADQFRFIQAGPTDDPIYDSGVGSGNRDRIIDFNSADGDHIGLVMDANVTDADFDPFHFVGRIDPGQALHTGQVGWFESNGSTIVTANTQAAPGSTFQIQLDGVGLGLTARDFDL
jgi:Ca2+-binding RTX toxin-like protein